MGTHRVVAAVLDSLHGHVFWGVTWITSTGWNNAMVGVREQQRIQSEGDMGNTKDWFAVFAATMMGALMLAFVVMVHPLPV